MTRLFKSAILCVTFLSIILISCYKEEVIFSPEPSFELTLPSLLKFDGVACAYDEQRKTLRYTLPQDSVFSFSPYVEFQDIATIKFDSIELDNEIINNLGAVSVSNRHTLTINTEKGIEKFTLEFTNLPIVQLIASSEIYDESKTLARLIIHDHTEHAINTFVGIEIRGASSQEFDKKSFGFSFMSGMDLSKTTSNSLFNLKPNTQWILDALYVDKSKLRKKVSFDLWQKMKNSPEHYGVQLKFVELYVNNDHRGIYCISENINAEFLDFYNNEALLYKTYSWEGTTFNPPIPDESSSILWNGWEQIHPNHKEKVNWKPLINLYTTILKKDNTYINQNISSQINLDNFIDYFIIIQLVGGSDNYGKNQILMKRNSSSPFYIIPWDLDATWGRDWLNTPTSTNAIFANNLFKQLIVLNPEQYKQRMKTRWNALRSTHFSEEGLKQLLDENFKTIQKSNIIAIEDNRWNTNHNLLEEKLFMENWLSKRLIFLDFYFNEL